MSKALKILLVLLTLFAFCNTASAQTKPKTTAKKTAKAPAKKTATVKKPAETSGYVCTSSKDKFYHKRSSCGALSKCPESIKYCATQGELAKWKRKRCTRCYNM
jgi:hypothetical protein